MSADKKDIKQAPQAWFYACTWSLGAQCTTEEMALSVLPRLKEAVASLCKKAVYQLEHTEVVDNAPEAGAEGPTLTHHNYHYQMHFNLKERQRPGQLAKALHVWCPGANCKPAHSPKAHERYCGKCLTRVAGPWDHEGSIVEQEVPYDGSDLPPIASNPYPWQGHILTEFQRPADDRDINWFYDPVGATGKSKFCKYLCFHRKACVMSQGKAADLAHFVTSQPIRTAYVFDLTRSHPQDIGKSDLYASLESVKNGYVVNTKYLTGYKLFKAPHVWVFANHLPNFAAMSADRWQVWTVSDNKEFVRWQKPPEEKKQKL